MFKMFVPEIGYKSMYRYLMYSERASGISRKYLKNEKLEEWSHQFRRAVKLFLLFHFIVAPVLSGTKCMDSCGLVYSVYFHMLLQLSFALKKLIVQLVQILLMLINALNMYILSIWSLDGTNTKC
jgi:hypothetical protein